MLVTSTFADFVQTGLQGEVTLTSFKNYLKDLRHENRMLARNDRKKDEDFIQIIHGLFYADPAVHETYDQLRAARDPADLKAVIALAESFLRGRVVSKQIDQLRSGGGARNGKVALIARLQTALAAKDTATVKTIMALPNISSDDVADALASTQAALAVSH